jgi:transposase
MACVDDPETRGLRELLRYQAFLVGLQRAVKNRIHALLDSLGVRPPMPTLFSRKGLKWLAGLELPAPYGEELRGPPAAALGPQAGDDRGGGREGAGGGQKR